MGPSVAEGGPISKFQVPTQPSNDRYWEDPDSWDLIIIGAGISGCALAHSQAKGKKRILVLERDLSQPDRFVGEFLQPAGILKLQELGLLHCVEDIDAQKVKGLCYHFPEKNAYLPYPVHGRCLHHGRFVQRLRTAAAAHKSVTLRQAVVTALLNSEGKALDAEDAVGGVLYRTTDGVQRRAMASLTVLCDGMHSNLRAKLGRPDVMCTSPTAAVTVIGCDLGKNRDYVQLYIGEPLLIVYPISSTEVRVMIGMPGTVKPMATNGEMRQYLAQTVAPRFHESLREGFLLALETGTVRRLATKRLPAGPWQRPGAVIIGDSLNMRHPAGGTGMSVALNDVKLLTEMLEEDMDFVDREKSVRSRAAFVSRRKALASTLNMLSNLVYDMFVVKESNDRGHLLVALQGYLMWSEAYRRSLALVSAGLDERPYMILIHAAGIFAAGAWHLFLSHPSLRGLGLVLRMLREEGPTLWQLIMAEGGPLAMIP